MPPLATSCAAIGRRDHLTVHWQQSIPAPGLPSEDATTAANPSINTSPARRPRRIGRIAIGATVTAAAIIVHIGPLGATA
jgi:hypothetical protein